MSICYKSLGNGRIKNSWVPAWWACALSVASLLSFSFGTTNWHKIGTASAEGSRETTNKGIFQLGPKWGGCGVLSLKHTVSAGTAGTEAENSRHIRVQTLNPSQIIYNREIKCFHEKREAILF